MGDGERLAIALRLRHDLGEELVRLLGRLIEADTREDHGGSGPLRSASSSSNGNKRGMRSGNVAGRSAAQLEEDGRVGSGFARGRSTGSTPGIRSGSARGPNRKPSLTRSWPALRRSSTRSTTRCAAPRRRGRPMTERRARSR